MIYPENLKRGDTIAILSPASTVNPGYIDSAAEILAGEGFNVRISPHAKGPASGSFASNRENRLSDLTDALQDSEIKAILCARGGYGCVHLLNRIPPSLIRNNPKWLIGYSDISALHALWLKSGVASLHAPMAKHIAEEGTDNEPVRNLLRILTSTPTMDYSWQPSPLNRSGRASGIITGGNLAVLNGLAGTPFDILGGDETNGGNILFIEDISEPIYAVERMLTRLALSGTFERISGLLVGQFTEYRPDRNFQSMEEMIGNFLDANGIPGIPVAFGMPAGHVSRNLPVIEGAEVELNVQQDSITLKTV